MLSRSQHILDCDTTENQSVNFFISNYTQTTIVDECVLKRQVNNNTCSISIRLPSLANNKSCFSRFQTPYRKLKMLLKKVQNDANREGIARVDLDYVIYCFTYSGIYPFADEYELCYLAVKIILHLVDKPWKIPNEAIAALILLQKKYYGNQDRFNEKIYKNILYVFGKIICNGQTVDNGVFNLLESELGKMIAKIGDISNITSGDNRGDNQFLLFPVIVTIINAKARNKRKLTDSERIFMQNYLIWVEGKGNSLFVVERFQKNIAYASKSCVSRWRWPSTNFTNLINRAKSGEALIEKDIDYLTTFFQTGYNPIIDYDDRRRKVIEALRYVITNGQKQFLKDKLHPANEIIRNCLNSHDKYLSHNAIIISAILIENYNGSCGNKEFVNELIMPLNKALERQRTMLLEALGFYLMDKSNIKYILEPKKLEETLKTLSNKSVLLEICNKSKFILYILNGKNNLIVSLLHDKRNCIQASSMLLGKIQTYKCAEPKTQKSMYKMLQNETYPVEARLNIVAAFGILAEEKAILLDVVKIFVSHFHEFKNNKIKKEVLYALAYCNVSLHDILTEQFIKALLVCLSNNTDMLKNACFVAKSIFKNYLGDVKKSPYQVKIQKIITKISDIFISNNGSELEEYSMHALLYAAKKGFVFDGTAINNLERVVGESKNSNAMKILLQIINCLLDYKPLVQFSVNFYFKLLNAIKENKYNLQREMGLTFYKYIFVQNSCIEPNKLKDLVDLLNAQNTRWIFFEIFKIIIERKWKINKAMCILLVNKYLNINSEVTRRILISLIDIIEYDKTIFNKDIFTKLCMALIQKKDGVCVILLVKILKRLIAVDNMALKYVSPKMCTKLADIINNKHNDFETIEESIKILYHFSQNQKLPYYTIESLALKMNSVDEKDLISIVRIVANQLKYYALTSQSINMRKKTITDRFKKCVIYVENIAVEQEKNHEMLDEIMSLFVQASRYRHNFSKKTVELLIDILLNNHNMQIRDKANIILSGCNNLISLHKEPELQLKLKNILTYESQARQILSYDFSKNENYYLAVLRQLMLMEIPPTVNFLLALEKLITKGGDISGIIMILNKLVDKKNILPYTLMNALTIVIPKIKASLIEQTLDLIAKAVLIGSEISDSSIIVFESHCIENHSFSKSLIIILKYFAKKSVCLKNTSLSKLIDIIFVASVFQSREAERYIFILLCLEVVLYSMYNSDSQTYNLKYTYLIYALNNIPDDKVSLYIAQILETMFNKKRITLSQASVDYIMSFIKHCNNISIIKKLLNFLKGCNTKGIKIAGSNIIREKRCLIALQNKNYGYDAKIKSIKSLNGKLIKLDYNIAKFFEWLIKNNDLKYIHELIKALNCGKSFVAGNLVIQQLLNLYKMPEFNKALYDLMSKLILSRSNNLSSIVAYLGEVILISEHNAIRDSSFFLLRLCPDYYKHKKNIMEILELENTARTIILQNINVDKKICNNFLQKLLSFDKTIICYYLVFNLIINQYGAEFLDLIIRILFSHLKTDLKIMSYAKMPNNEFYRLFLNILEHRHKSARVNYRIYHICESFLTYRYMNNYKENLLEVISEQLNNTIKKHEILLLKNLICDVEFRNANLVEKLFSILKNASPNEMHDELIDLFGLVIYKTVNLSKVIELNELFALISPQRSRKTFYEINNSISSNFIRTINLSLVTQDEYSGTEITNKKIQLLSEVILYCFNYQYDKCKNFNRSHVKKFKKLCLQLGGKSYGDTLSNMITKFNNNKAIYYYVTMLSCSIYNMSIFLHLNIDSYTKIMLTEKLLHCYLTSTKNESNNITKFHTLLFIIDQKFKFKNFDPKRDAILIILIQKQRQEKLSLKKINEILYICSNFTYKKVISLLKNKAKKIIDYYYNEVLGDFKNHISNKTCFIELRKLLANSVWGCEQISSFLQKIHKKSDGNLLCKLFKLLAKYDIDYKNISRFMANVKTVSSWLYIIRGFIVLAKISINLSYQNNVFYMAEKNNLKNNFFDDNKDYVTYLIVSRINRLVCYGWSFDRLVEITATLKSRDDFNIEKIANLFDFVYSYKLNEAFFYETLNSNPSVNLNDMYKIFNQKVYHSSIHAANQTKSSKKIIEEFIGLNKNNIEIQNLLKKGYLETILEKVKYHFANNAHALNKKSISSWVKEDILKWARNIKNTRGSFEILLPEILAVCKQACRLVKNFEPFDVQLFTSMFLSKNNEATKGRFAQMATGEGKTIVTAMFAVFNVLQGYSVDIISDSHVTARQNANSCKDFYKLFDIEISINHEHNYKSGLKKCYSDKVDIVYGSISDFQFDFLRHEHSNLKTRGNRKQQVVIIDEVDNILIDQNSNIAMLSMPIPGFDFLTPILIDIWIKLESFFNNSSPYGFRYETDKLYYISMHNLESKKHIKVDYNTIIQLVKDDLELYLDKELNKKTNVIYKGIPDNLSEFIKTQKKRWINSAFIAKFEYSSEINYLVKKHKSNEPKIKPIDLINTGVIQHDTIWSDGLHQFLQIVNNLKITSENVTTKFISNLYYIQKYQKIYGLTGTLGKKEHCDLLAQEYNIDFVYIPTYKEDQCIDMRGIVLATQQEWIAEILYHAIEIAQRKRAVLIIVKSIKEANIMFSILFQKFQGKIIKFYDSDDIHNQLLKCELQPNTIVIATTLAGRNIDVKINKEVVQHGGLHVCVTFLHLNSRSFIQCKGRAGRNGEPGSVQLVINLEGLVDEQLKKEKRAEDIYYYIAKPVEYFLELRNKRELEHIEKIRTIDLPKIKQNDLLHDKYRMLIRDIKHLESKEKYFNNEVNMFINDPIFKQSLYNKILAKSLFNFRDNYRRRRYEAVEERWGVWLKHNTLNNNKNGDNITFKNFEIFKTTIINDYKNNTVIKNPYYYMLFVRDIYTYMFSIFGRIAQPVHKLFYRFSIYILNKTLKSTPEYVYMSYYNRAFAYLQLDGIKYIADIKADLCKALDIINNFVIPKIYSTDNMLLALNNVNSYKEKNFGQQNIMLAKKQNLLELQVIDELTTSIVQNIREIERSQRLIDMEFYSSNGVNSKITKQYLHEKLTEKDASALLKNGGAEKKCIIKFHSLRNAQAIQTISAINNDAYTISIFYQDLRSVNDISNEVLLKKLLPINRHKSYKEISAQNNSVKLAKEPEMPPNLVKIKQVSSGTSNVVESLYQGFYRTGAKIVNKTSGVINKTIIMPSNKIKDKTADYLYKYKSLEDCRVALETSFLGLYEVITLLDSIKINKCKFDFLISNLAQNMIVNLQKHFPKNYLKEYPVKTNVLLRASSSTIMPNNNQILVIGTLGLEQSKALISLLQKPLKTITVNNDIQSTNDSRPKKQYYRPIIIKLRINDLSQKNAEQLINKLNITLTLCFDSLTKSNAKKILSLVSDLEQEPIIQINNINISQAQSIISNASRKAQAMQVFCEKALKNFPIINDMSTTAYNFSSKGYIYFFNLSEKAPIPWRKVATVAAFAVIQLSAGAFLTGITSGMGTAVSMMLISEGFFDLLRAGSAIYYREHGWNSYAMQKSISYALGMSSVLWGAHIGKTSLLAFDSVDELLCVGDVVRKMISRTSTVASKQLLSLCKNTAMSKITDSGLNALKGGIIKSTVSPNIEEEVKIQTSLLLSSYRWKSLLNKIFIVDRFIGNNDFQQKLISKIEEVVKQHSTSTFHSLLNIDRYIERLSQLSFAKLCELEKQTPSFGKLLQQKVDINNNNAIEIQRILQGQNILLKNGKIDLSKISSCSQSDTDFHTDSINWRITYNPKLINHNKLKLFNFNKYKEDVINACIELLKLQHANFIGSRELFISRISAVYVKVIMQNIKKLSHRIQNNIVVPAINEATRFVKNTSNNMRNRDRGQKSRRLGRNTRPYRIGSSKNIHNVSNDRGKIRPGRNTRPYRIDSSKNIHNISNDRGKIRPGRNTRRYRMDSQQMNIISNNELRKQIPVNYGNRSRVYNGGMRGNMRVSRISAYPQARRVMLRSRGCGFSSELYLLDYYVLRKNYQLFVNAFPRNAIGGIYSEIIKNLQVFIMERRESLLAKVQNFHNYVHEEFLKVQSNALQQFKKYIKLLLILLILDVKWIHILNTKDMSELQKKHFEHAQKNADELCEKFFSAVDKKAVYEAIYKKYEIYAKQHNNIKGHFVTLKQFLGDLDFLQKTLEEKTMSYTGENVVSTISNGVGTVVNSEVFKENAGKFMELLKTCQYDSASKLLHEKKLGEGNYLIATGINGLIGCYKANLQYKTKLADIIYKTVLRTFQREAMTNLFLAKLEDKKQALLKRTEESLKDHKIKYLEQFSATIEKIKQAEDKKEKDETKYEKAINEFGEKESNWSEKFQQIKMKQIEYLEKKITTNYEHCAKEIESQREFLTKFSKDWESTTNRFLGVIEKEIEGTNEYRKLVGVSVNETVKTSLSLLKEMSKGSESSFKIAVQEGTSLLKGLGLFNKKAGSKEDDKKSQQPALEGKNQKESGESGAQVKRPKQ